MIAFPEHGDGKPPDERSLDHFREIYRTLESAEIAERCALPFIGEESAFALRVMGTEYRVPFPNFELLPPPGFSPPLSYEKVLFIRYLCYGKYAEAGGGQLSYREIPWGDLYYHNFERRCIRRFAYTFGNDLERFRRIMEGSAGLRAQRLDKGEADNRPLSHAAYRFEFCTGLFMSVLLWAADDEFPPSAQILFDDNIPAAFTAEDLAVACGTAADHLKDMAAGPAALKPANRA
jgi:hypothetical protein